MGVEGGAGGDLQSPTGRVAQGDQVVVASKLDRHGVDEVRRHLGAFEFVPVVHAQRLGVDLEHNALGQIALLRNRAIEGLAGGDGEFAALVETLPQESRLDEEFTDVGHNALCPETPD